MVFAIDPRLVATGVFVAVYALILLGLRELTAASLAGAAILLLLGILTPEQAWGHVDFDVIALLIGVMVVSRVLSHVGFFRWLGIHMANLVRCDPPKMMVLFLGVSALLTAFAGATVVVALMMSMVVMELMDVLELDPRPYILGVIFAVNIAGMSTSVSSLPTILVASAWHLSFADVASMMWAPAIVDILVLTALMLFFSRRELLKARPAFTRIPISPSEVITDKKLFSFSFIMFVLMVVGFVAGPSIGLTPGAVALITAAILLIVGGKRIGPVVKEVDWETVLSIMGLLIIVGALEETGAITSLANFIAPGLSRDKASGITIMLWTSALASAVVDNVPFTMAMISTLKAMGSLGAGYLRWALVVGTCLGGNGTIIASYANLVVVSQASEKGYEIDPRAFMKMGMCLLFATAAVSDLVLLAELAR
mgnify:FL=1